MNLYAGRLRGTVYDVFNLCVDRCSVVVRLSSLGMCVAVEVADCIPVTGLVTPRTTGAGHHIEAARELPIPSETQPAQRRSTAAHGAGQQDSRGFLPFGLTSCCYHTVQQGGRNYVVLHGRRRRAVVLPGERIVGFVVGQHRP